MLEGGNVTSLSMAQSAVLLRFLESKIDDSIDELVKRIGITDAFVLIQLRERLVRNLKKKS